MSVVAATEKWVLTPSGYSLGAIKLVSVMLSTEAPLVDAAVHWTEGDTVNLPATGYFPVYIGSEKVRVTAVTDLTSTGATLSLDRSAYGATAVRHEIDAVVSASGPRIAGLVQTAISTVLGGTNSNILGDCFGVTAVADELTLAIAGGVACVEGLFLVADGIGDTVELSTAGTTCTNLYRYAAVGLDVDGVPVVTYGVAGAANPPAEPVMSSSVVIPLAWALVKYGETSVQAVVDKRGTLAL